MLILLLSNNNSLSISALFNYIDYKKNKYDRKKIKIKVHIEIYYKCKKIKDLYIYHYNINRRNQIMDVFIIDSAMYISEAVYIYIYLINYYAYSKKKFLK